MNKQLFSPLSLNNPLSRTALGQYCILMIDRYLNAKKKNTPLMLQEFIIYLLLISAIWLSHSQHWAIDEGAVSLTDVNHCVRYLFDPKVI